MAHAGMDASTLARAAGLAPSTLTRYLNQRVKHILSTRTLNKLYAASDLPPEVPVGGYLVDQPDQIALLMFWDGLSTSAKRALMLSMKRFRAAPDA